ncbi:MAG: hypothetical protein AB1342_00315 [Pseudomonadota bacterium]
MRSILIAGIAFFHVAPALAEDPVGCDKFKFPIDAERAALGAAALPSVAPGSDVKLSAAQTIALLPLADAKLPKPPEREQKPGTFAGAVNLTSVAGGTYNVVVSDYAWVDVVQNGSYLKPKDHSGVKGCDIARKAMKFELSAGSATIQLSGVAGNAIRLAVFPSR